MACGCLGINYPPRSFYLIKGDNKMSQVSITVSQFQQDFPEFNSIDEQVLESMLKRAQLYISTQNYRISPEVRTMAIELMTAHLLTIYQANTNSNNGDLGSQTNGALIASATIEGVSISLQAPIASNAFEQWIQSTSYGKEYWALLKVNNPVGVFWVGSPRAFGIR